MKSVSQRVRSLKRLLNNDKLEPAARRAKQAELDALTNAKQTLDKKRRQKLNSKKYHKVRFFERRKCERKIGKLQKQAAAAEDAGGADALRTALEEARADLLYVQHFPRHKKYLSLFPADGADVPAVAKMRAKIRARIVRLDAEGKLSEPTDDERDEENLVLEGGGADFASLEDDAFFDEAPVEPFEVKSEPPRTNVRSEAAGISKRSLGNHVNGKPGNSGKHKRW